MAFVKKDRVRERSTTTGTGAFTLAGAAAGYRTFASVMSVADTCWYCIVHPGTAWECGLGTYSGASTLTRTTVYDSSNSGSAVNFASGSKDVFIGLPAKNASFEPGTLMLFQQTSAPVGWTKQTTHNDKALRVVSGTASSGGTNAFSTVMAQTTVGSTTLSTSQIPAHSHAITLLNAGGALLYIGGGSSTYTGGGYGLTSVDNLFSINNTGGGGSHDHTITLGIQYVDLIIAMKD